MYNKLKVAYILGCKMAQIDNANQLAEALKKMDGKKPIKGESIGEVSDVMRNFNEKRMSEQSAPYGEKHQLAINPEWSGP